jgi:trimeric autotransporter adhesin
MKTKNNFFIGLLFILAGIMIHISSQAQSWSPLANGTDGTISATCVFNDELYVGGTFTTAGNIQASNIAKWNGKQWLALGSGFDASVNAICVYNGELYAGGMFTASGTEATSHIAKWNGTAWIPVGTGIDGRVSAMVVFNN